MKNFNKVYDITKGDYFKADLLKGQYFTSLNAAKKAVKRAVLDSLRGHVTVTNSKDGGFKSEGCLIKGRFFWSR